MKLYELTNEYQRLADALVGEDGEMSPEAELYLDRLQGEIGTKVDWLCCLVQQFRANASAATTEAKRLDAMGRTETRAADKVIEYIKRNLEYLGMERIQTERFRVRIQKNGRPSISWTLSTDPPAELSRTIVEFNNSAAYLLWKDGVPLPEGVAVEHGSHLRIS